MQKYIPILKRTKIFAGVGYDEIVSMLSCLGARLKTYKKGECVLRQGEHITDITMLVRLGRTLCMEFLRRSDNSRFGSSRIPCYAY